MSSWWPVVEVVLQRLTTKLASLHDGGLDLVFTIGKDYNVSNAQGLRALEEFNKAMGTARPTESPKRECRMRTDMRSTLLKIFNNYSPRPQKKGMSLIVLTDGIWEGSVKEKSIVFMIAEYYHRLKETVEYRKLGIEIVQFGRDLEATRKLKRIGADLEKKYKIS
jgi:hypothetical protein